jgi:pimeloyl-ACP methyl ester carboxylesterase
MSTPGRKMKWRTFVASVVVSAGDRTLSERLIQENGLDIATEAFGNPAHPPVLLIMGGGASMLWWPEEFCERLAHHGRYVIRYDQRDTGHSTRFTEGDPSYSLDDLVEDAIGVLDAYALSAAHLVGMSLGAIIGQLVALNHPSRVLTLTAISSSPFGMDTSHLPGSSGAYNEHLATAEDVNWSDRAQVIAYSVKESRLIAGTARPFSEEATRAFVARDYDRSGGYSTLSNFAWRGGDAWRGRLHEMQAPLLVMHGTADPVYPIEHGVALADVVAGAKLVRLDGGGHELHRADWDTIIGAIVEHTSIRAADDLEITTTIDANAAAESRGRRP